MDKFYEYIINGFIAIMIAIVLGGGACIAHCLYVDAYKKSSIVGAAPTE